jgi:histone deacetylase 8
LYIDLDVHHGDGVENAFIYSDKVFTFSIHKYLPGFFPGTGNFEAIGQGKGIGYCLNVPVSHKISGDGFYSIFSNSFNSLVSKFDPDIIVCVCGADILSDDPHAAFNVGSKAYSNCVQDIINTQIPSIFLGGGGYNHTSTAKCWSILTQVVISNSGDVPELPKNIPEHVFWPAYSMDDALEVIESEINVINEQKLVQNIIKSVESILRD